MTLGEGRSVALAGIGQLVTCEPGEAPKPGNELGVIENAALVAQDGRIVWLGREAEMPAVDEVCDVGGRCVTPGFVDSHTHIVFAGDRSAEFEARMAGEPYTGGGIASTVEATRRATDDQLASRATWLVAEARAQGTTTVEIKSGYGLTVADEARSVRIATSLTEETTFLGAHVVPEEYADDREGYVALVLGEMLAACASDARWIDVFCEPASAHAFDEDESRAVLAAGVAAGLAPRLHGNQLAVGPGIRLAVEIGAASVDHCTYLTDADLALLAEATAARRAPVATLLPIVEMATRSPWPDAAALARVAEIALATDCNPGTGYSTSMPLAIALAVAHMGLTPAQALLAATRGGAAALRRTDIGRLAVGTRADVAVVDAPSHVHLAYRPGVPLAHGLSIAPGVAAPAPYGSVG